ncbi:MAG: hypothetical protein KME35_21710 [Aphanocapsa sp. GSE-SYN-MK-11-07L]|jgi:hypothetical protein|nr:hypothetical protein [Aphanocapsa sp. GSE-SYN-MK-11-07L]
MEFIQEVDEFSNESRIDSKPAKPIKIVQQFDGFSFHHEAIGEDLLTVSTIQPKDALNKGTTFNNANGRGSEAYDKLIGNFSLDSFSKLRGMDMKSTAYPSNLVNDTLINFTGEMGSLESSAKGKDVGDSERITFEDPSDDRPSSVPGRLQEIIDSKFFVSSLDRRPINQDAKTYIVIHGFQNTINEPWIKDMQAALLKKDSTANVLAYEWPSNLSADEYGTAAAGTQDAGLRLAHWIKDKGLDPANVELIGHSLGAHVAGYAGYAINSLFDNRKHISQIVGLDPAGPLFEDGVIFKKQLFSGLSPAAAHKVIAFHTDLRLGGIKREVGHVDVYVNLATANPGDGKSSMITRDHSYAYILFIQFLEGKSFTQPDDSKEDLDSILRKNGRFDLQTTSQPILPYVEIFRPYCIEDLGSETDDKLSLDRFNKLGVSAGACNDSLIADNLINFPRDQRVSSQGSEAQHFGNSTEILGSGFLKNVSWEQFAPVSSPAQLTLGSVTQSNPVLSGLGDAVNAENHYNFLNVGSEILSGSKLVPQPN